MKRLITLILFVSSLTMAAAQQVGVEAKIDSVAIMIGEQTHLQLTITARQGAKIVYPHYKRSQYIVLRCLTIRRATRLLSTAIGA